MYEDVIHRLQKVWEGNGQEGLSKTIPALQAKIEMLQQSIEKHSSKLDSLQREEAKSEGIRMGEANKKNEDRVNSQIKIAKIAIFSSAGTALILKIIELMLKV
jgi:hypothetical protein